MSCSCWADKLQASIFIIYSLILCAQSDVPRPRGVSLSKAPLYSPTKDFTCFDGTITIPFIYVNDDYCDCFDGSDEPGTSACLNGIFHCTNAGHRSQNIPSSRVNDGVCDCCDGTDEYASVVNCPNTCEELGREARAEAQRLAELHKAGSQVRHELIDKGNKKRAEMAEQLAQLEKDKVEAEKVKIEKEALKNELEAMENEALKVYREAEELEKQKKADEEKQAMIKEATVHFERYDSNSDGILTRVEMSAVNVFDKDKDGQVDEEEYRYFLNENESVDKETFFLMTWPLLKPLIMMEQGMFKPAVETPDAQETEHDQQDDEESLPEDEELHKEDEELDPEDHDVDDNADLDADLPHDEEDHHVDADLPVRTYDDETQKLVDEATQARQQLTEAERSIREIEANIKNIRDNLAKDYGLHQEFATLDGQCFEYQDKEYIYKLCLFQKVTQQSKGGHADVGLGNWGEWAGDENNKYSIMKYTNGVNCWNGPNRMTTVHIHCGLETKLLSVTEPFRCEYKMELSTPAACDGSQTAQHSSHDEL